MAEVLTAVYSDIIRSDEFTPEALSAAIVATAECSVDELLARLPRHDIRALTEAQAHSLNADDFVKSWLKRSSRSPRLLSRSWIQFNEYLPEDEACHVLSGMGLIPPYAWGIGRSVLSHSEAGKLESKADIVTSDGWRHDVVSGVKESKNGFILRRYQRGFL